MLANNVDQGSLHDLIMKYYFSIRRKDNTQSVDFLWLLQGKDDSLRTDAHFYHCGNISQTQVDRFKYSTAIIQLTPDFGNQDVVDALKVYL